MPRFYLLLIACLLSANSFAQDLLFTSTIGGDKAGGSIVKYNLTTGEMDNAYSHDANPLWGGSILKADYDFGGLHMGSDGYIYGLESSVASPWSPDVLDGALYRFHPDSMNYEILHSFSELNDTGYRRPLFKLVETEPGVFYGLCEEGGSEDYGGVWKYTVATRKYEEIGDFNTKSAPGNHPASSLTFGPNGDLYGVLRRAGETVLSGVNRTPDINGRFTRRILDPYGTGQMYKVNLKKDSLEVVDNLVGQGSFLITHANGELIYHQAKERFYGVMRWSIVPESQKGGGVYAQTFDPNDPLYTNSGLFSRNKTVYRAQITFDRGDFIGESFTNMLAGNNGKYYIQSLKGTDLKKGSLIQYDGSNEFTKVISFPYHTHGIGTIAAKEFIIGTYNDGDATDGLWVHGTTGGTSNLTNAVSTKLYGDVQPFMAFDGQENIYLRTRLVRDGQHNQGYILKYNINSREVTVLDTLFAPNGRHLKGELTALTNGQLLTGTAYGGGSATTANVGNLSPTFNSVDLKTKKSEFKFRYQGFDIGGYSPAEATKGSDGNLYKLYSTGYSAFTGQQISMTKLDPAGNVIGDQKIGNAFVNRIKGVSMIEYDSLQFIMTTGEVILKYDQINQTTSQATITYNSEAQNPSGGMATTDKLNFYGLTGGLPDVLFSDGTVASGTYALLYKYDLQNDAVSVLVDLGKKSITPNMRPSIWNDKVFWVSNEPDISTLYTYDIVADQTETLVLDKATQGSDFIGELAQHNGKMYAVSYSGGQYNMGVLLEFDPAQKSTTVLKHLTSRFGKPFGSNILVLADDQDGDGISDSFDQCPNTPAGESVDANGCAESQKDDDGDGVSNSLDQCPNSPKNETVDANGCAPSQRDTDGDGLNDKEDHCPNTPAGESVDQYGCSANQNDGDGDGVLNADDQCPNTPAGEAVDANGCSDSQKDTDGDGINDADDHCPNTPAGETVDVHGCSPSQLDGDGDGVSNAVDQCPNTPSGEAVDTNGCSDSQKDDDSDGVMNNVDQCPNTPIGESVDANGCSESQKDDDGDGIVNTLDHCPGTAAGETVDVHGCTVAETDGDGDGVLNQFDKCPNTPAGVQVNSDGCATSQLDSDKDGVTDDKDLCPNTFPGLMVNADGCANNQIDTDGDGVYDAIDHCDNTPSGEKADEHGCSPSQLDTDRDGVTNNLDQCPATPIGATVNASGCSTGQLDTDGDGVSDNSDVCPNTPAGQIVDINGCSLSQKDGDKDGVTDDVDHCPNTPAGTAVDANGCPAAEPDGDGDGVPNASDQCSNTPAGATVDANGCAESQKDSDGDGVQNSDDVCPNTPAGEQADFTGCAPSQLDSDRDGVHDDIDQCPNTAQGESVDAHGCSPHQLDNDNDGVPNDIDQCTNTPAGTTVNSVGCAPANFDTDNDGITDDKDLCPNTPRGASVNTDGCSISQVDSDSDGVYDSEDHCPNTPIGTVVDVHGCATSQIDSDGDGVTNNLDSCPNTPSGIEVDTNGCPAYLMAVLGRPVFEDTPLGLISTSTFEILNNGGNSGLEINSIDTPIGFSVDISSASLGAGESMTVTITFLPTEAKTYSGVITINSSNVASQSIAVSAEGAVITEIGNNLSPQLISLSPNPVNDYLTIDLKNLTLSNPRLLIYNLDGIIQLNKEELRSDTEVIDVRGYIPGIYVIMIVTNEGTLIKKFIRL